MYNCTILIPYRQRKHHLDYFIKNTASLVERVLPNSRIVIIEQDNDKLFNRGLLLNIGFKEYSDSTEYFITHDVDINPNENTILTYYTKEVPDFSVMGIYTSASNTLGGIIKMKSNIPGIVNGFPNNFWGWGVEDKALQNRCEFYNINVSKNILNNNPNRFDYFTIFNDVDDRITAKDMDTRTSFEYNQFKYMSGEKQSSHILSSGLNNCPYIVKRKVTFDSNIEHIYVDFN
jgi:hypothetical protein